MQRYKSEVLSANILNCGFCLQENCSNTKSVYLLGYKAVENNFFC